MADATGGADRPPPPQGADGGGRRRATVLVNIWLNYLPEATAALPPGVRAQLAALGADASVGLADTDGPLRDIPPPLVSAPNRPPACCPPGTLPSCLRAPPRPRGLLAAPHIRRVDNTNMVGVAGGGVHVRLCPPQHWWGLRRHRWAAQSGDPGDREELRFGYGLVGPDDGTTLTLICRVPGGALAPEAAGATFELPLLDVALPTAAAATRNDDGGSDSDGDGENPAG